MSVSEERPTRKRLLKFLKFGVVAALAVGVVAVLSVAVLLRDLGDPAPGGLLIENRTEQTVIVYSVAIDERIYPLLTLGPRSIVESGVDCPNELVAQTLDGVEIARRPQPSGCDVDHWIIDGASIES